MWLFEKRGFGSVVAYDPKKDRNPDSEFRNIAKEAGTHLLVRARIKEDLDMFKTVDPDLLVETDAGADYAYRAVITRDAMKQFMCEVVDGITYDSHFKEVARDNSPKAGGRYSAMMSVWSAMAKLQPIKPWSGGWGSSSKSTPVRSTPTTVPTIAENVDEFTDRYYQTGGEQTYRNGGGPRTGFAKGDRVVGYSGVGEVVEVKASAFEGAADSVVVKMDDGRTTQFISNYLMPEDLPDLDEDDEDIYADENGSYDLDYMYDFLCRCADGGEDLEVVEAFPDDLLLLLEDDAFELLTRVQEEIAAEAVLTKTMLEDKYDEILWEQSSDEQRVALFSDAARVPDKYQRAAIDLFNQAG